MGGRVSVGIGTKATYEFNQPVARMVSLAGVQPKLEMVTHWTGTIIAIRDTGKKLQNGKPDYETDVEALGGAVLTVSRSWVKFCVVISE